MVIMFTKPNWYSLITVKQISVRLTTDVILQAVLVHNIKCQKDKPSVARLSMAFPN